MFIFNLHFFENCDFGIGVLKVFVMILGIPKSQFTVSKQHFGPHKMISAVSKIMSTHGPFMLGGYLELCHMKKSDSGPSAIVSRVAASHDENELQPVW